MHMIESILAFPHTMRKGNTAYPRDLYSGLARLGVETRDYNRYLYRPPSTSCFHFHWPDRVTGGLGRYSPALGRRAIATFERTIAAYRAAGKPVFWTVHNDRPHDFRAPAFARTYDVLMQSIGGSIDGFVFLNAFSRNRFLETNPDIRAESCVVIPHMLPDVDRADVRPPPELGRPASSDGLFLVPGQIRAHKSIPRAIAIYQSIRQEGDRLCIAGPPSDRACLAEIRALAAADPSILLIARALGDAEMHHLYDRAKAVFALNAGSKNSGVLFTALALGRRVIVSSGPVSDEIGRLAGADRLLPAESDPATLRRMVQAPAGSSAPPPELSLASVSRRYCDFFSRVAAERAHRPRVAAKTVQAD